MSASHFKFDVTRTVEEICLRCQHERHDEEAYISAVIDELEEYLAEIATDQPTSSGRNI